MYYKSKTRKRSKVGKLVKSRKYSNLRKHSKKRRGTYKYRTKTQYLHKKRISITRKRNGRKMYGGVGECDTAVEKRARDAIATFPKGFKTFFDILEKCPDIIKNGDVQREYTQKIELKDGTRKIGYIGLLGLQLINYLNARITKLRIQRDELIKTGTRDNDELLNDIKKKIGNLKTAISLMDQVAAAPGIGEDQLKTVRGNVDERYYDCYVKLYNELADELELEKRNIPLSTSLCYFSKNSQNYDIDTDSEVCDTDSEVCDTCCIPTGVIDNTEPTTKRQRVQ
jgi:hypothetical protein